MGNNSSCLRVSWSVQIPNVSNGHRALRRESLHAAVAQRISGRRWRGRLAKSGGFAWSAKPELTNVQVLSQPPFRRTQMSADRTQIVEFSPGSRALRERDRAPGRCAERPAPAPQWGLGLNAYADGGASWPDLNDRAAGAPLGLGQGSDRQED